MLPAALRLRRLGAQLCCQSALSALGVAGWASAAGGGGAAPPHAQAGLFGIARLRAPQDYAAWAREAKDRCQDLLQQLDAAPHDASVVQLMDDMSDAMCQVYDSAEACRHVHADPAWRAAATHVCQELGAYISEINQHEGMYRKLRETMERLQRSRQASTSDRCSKASTTWHDSSSAVCAGERQHLLTPVQLAGFDREATLVGLKLQQDMDRAGIGIPDQGERRRVQQLLAASNHYPAAYNSALTDPTKLGYAAVPAHLLPAGWRASGAHRGRVHVALDGPTIHHFLSSVPSEDARKQVYLEGYEGPAENLQLLDQMIAARHATALALGAPSFAHFKAQDGSLAGRPEAVVAFLGQLARGVRQLADAEVAALARLKARDTGSRGARLAAWDVDFYTAQARLHAFADARRAVRPFLQLDSVLAGLDQLLGRLFGLRLVPAPLAAGEGWATGLKRLDVLRDGERLGVLYLDMQARPSKLPGSVLFPIVCGRALPGGAYQEPVLLLVTSCGEEGDSLTLSWRELRTFVHEMGHACHNFLSHTRFQHLWGTRCAQDVVEIPSHLWEQFVSDHRTASLLARHASSRDPLPAALHADLVASSAMFPAMELQHQVLLAQVDQAYFGPRQPLPGGTSAVWQQLADSYSSIAHVPGTHVQARFSHLTIYGACYYSYIYARCLSAAIWQQHLAADPLDRAAGEQLQQALLRPGGSVEPLELVQGTLGVGSSAALQPLHGGWAPCADDLLRVVASASQPVRARL